MMKTFNETVLAGVRCGRTATGATEHRGVCMFQVGHGSRIERGANVPVPDLLEQMIVLGNTANPVFIEHLGGQWHLDHAQRLVPEQGSARLATPENNFAVAPDGAIWNASLGRLHVRRPSDGYSNPLRCPAAPSSCRTARPSPGQACIRHGGRWAGWAFCCVVIAWRPWCRARSPAGAYRVSARLAALQGAGHWRQRGSVLPARLDATGHLRQLGQVDADDGSWWRSSVAELRQQQGLLLSTDDESYLVPMQLPGCETMCQSRCAGRSLWCLAWEGIRIAPIPGAISPPWITFLAFGRLDGFSPFRPGAALQQMSVDDWQRVPD